MTIMIGIDPHKATHTAVAVDDNEAVLDEFKVQASNVQTQRLCDWAGGFEKREWAIESANGLGYLVAQQLVAAGETVFDVPPVFASRVRLLGSDRSQKNDPNDARSVAIAALRSDDARSVAIAALRSDRLNLVRPDDHARVLHLLAKRHRDMARLRNKHCPGSRPRATTRPTTPPPRSKPHPADARDTGSTREGTANSTTPSTSPRSPNFATTPKAGSSTTPRSPRASHLGTPSEP